jgi:hypothetical protein
MKPGIILALLACILLVPFAWASNAEKPSASSLGLASEARLSSSGGAGSLTTLFHANSGYAGNMLDIAPLTNIQEISSLDVNVGSLGEKIEVQVYYRKGTCVGFQEDASAWTFLGEGTGISAGLDQPSFIDLAGNGVCFQAGKTYGFYVHLENYPFINDFLRYTNGGPGTYANSDLSVTTYYGKGFPAFGATFPYRVWNGTIYYETGTPDPLRVEPNEISGWFGGSAEFRLFGGANLAGLKYALFSSISGNAPGTPLPGGLVLPLNWDPFTEFMLMLALSGTPLVTGFIGQLDTCGEAEAMLTLPGNLPAGFAAHFAWCTYSPFDFVSNPANLTITGMPGPPAEYVYDDGTSNNALGWKAGGEAVWAHYFEAGAGDTITEVSSTFGWSEITNGPPNGTPCWVYVWEDPTDDNNPIDCVLVGTGSGVVANTNTDTFNVYALDTPAAVSGGFFVACHVHQAVDILAAPMDTNTPYNGRAWFMGGTTFNPSDLSTTSLSEMGSIGFPSHWLLRADND